MAELVVLIVLVLFIYGIGNFLTKENAARNKNHLVPFNKDIENWGSNDKSHLENKQKRKVHYRDLSPQLMAKLPRRILQLQDNYHHYRVKPLHISNHPKTEWKAKSESLGNRSHVKTSSVDYTDLADIAAASNYSVSDYLREAINECDKAFGHYSVRKPHPVGKLTPPPDEPVLYKISDLGDDEFFKYLTPKDKEILDDYLETVFVESKEKWEVATTQHRTASEATEVELLKAVANWENDANNWDAACLADKNKLEEIKGRFFSQDCPKQLVELAIRTAPLPDWIPNECSTSYDEVAGILVVEHKFPFIEEIDWFKQVELKSSTSIKPLNSTERKKTSAEIYPLLTIAIATIAVKNVNLNDVKLIVVNGWVDYRSKETGEEKRAFCSSLVAEPSEIAKINLIYAEPMAAFKMLKGVTSPSLELAPVAPKLRLNMHDDRFVEGKEVLQGLIQDENLASMDWEDFEHLCRQLFEKIFAAEGATVSVTQASRDQGVDAVIIDPDPIRGGKIVIQAKRYVNTVDVSAVRDLWGVVSHEGAMKGLLVTTSNFGPDSYSFAKGKPLTLINGGELLHELERHGYKFRINLEEARQMQRESGLPSFRKRK